MKNGKEGPEFKEKFGKSGGEVGKKGSFAKKMSGRGSKRGGVSAKSGAYKK